MYRIISKIHTISNNFYEMYMVLNDNNELVEYGVDTLKEAQTKAKELLCKKGYCDLRIIEDNVYHIDLLEGAEPKPEETFYSLSIKALQGQEDMCSIVPQNIEHIKKNASVNVGVTFNQIIPSFHLIIDGVEYKQGIPEWIEFKPMGAQEGILYFNGITNNHEIIIQIDK